MIKVDGNTGALEFKGTKLDLMAELTGVINALLDANLFTVDEVDMCVETAKKTKKELNDELMEMLSNILQSSELMIK